MIGGSCSRRAWGLWEMLEIKAAAFYLASSQIVSTSSWIGATTLAASKGEERVFHEDAKLDVNNLGFLRGRLEALREHLDDLGAKVTRLAVIEAIDNLRSPNATWGHAKTRFDEISNTLRRELSSVTLLALETKEQSYF